MIYASIAVHVSDVGTHASTAAVTGADAKSAVVSTAVIYAVFATGALNAGVDVIRSVPIAKKLLLRQQ